ncbi:MAG: hypothetical protein K2H09_01330 [Treponemataceae bacterium]|nr:hypothetical protein [Treponemataceae bacterium]
MTIEEAENLVYRAVLFAQNNGEFHEGEKVEADYLDAYFILVRELELKSRKRK